MTESSTMSLPGLVRRVEAGVLRTLTALPRPMVRAIAGRPVVIDDNTLDVDIQVIPRLQKPAGGAAESPARAAVGGDSSGGSLAARAAIRAAEEGFPLRLRLLIHPATRIGDSGPGRESEGLAPAVIAIAGSDPLRDEEKRCHDAS